MNLHHLWLLILLILSAYSESPQHVRLPAPIIDHTAHLGILALGLPQTEVFDRDRIIPALNGYNITIKPQNEVYKITSAHIGCKIVNIILPYNGCTVNPIPIYDGCCNYEIQPCWVPLESPQLANISLNLFSLSSG